MQFTKLFISIFSLYFIVRQLVRFIKQEQTQTFLKTLSILTIWTGIIGVVWFIKMNYFLVSILFAFIIVFLLIFKLLAIIEKIERDITEIIRKEALQGAINLKLRKSEKNKF